MGAYESATRCAESFLKEMKIAELPVNPFTLAKNLGIECHEKAGNEEGVSGMLIRHGNRFAIAYATHIGSEGFQRFSVSHEIGHFKLPGHFEAIFKNGDIHQSCAGFVSIDKYEREADHFASGLLMPAGLFRGLMNNVDEGLDAIERLATRCVTSLTATAIRYVQLTDTPIAIVLSIGNQIEWCSRSDTLKEVPGIDWIRKQTPLPRNSATYVFNQGNSNITNARRKVSTGNFQDWFNGQYDIEIIEEIKGLGGYGRTLTVLTVQGLDLEILEDEKGLEETWTPYFRR